MVVDFIPWLLENPEVGWVAVILYLMWEIRGPKGKIKDLSERIEGIVVVVRALADVHDGIKTEKVDDYLVKNGSEPSDFIRGEKGRSTPEDLEELTEDDESRSDQSRSSGDD